MDARALQGDCHDGLGLVSDGHAPNGDDVHLLEDLVLGERSGDNGRDAALERDDELLPLGGVVGDGDLGELQRRLRQVS